MAGMDFSKITETLTDLMKNPELDKTKKALKGLAEDVKQNIQPDELLAKIQKAFNEDLAELKIQIPADGRSHYWEMIEVRVREYIEDAQKRAAETSPEANALEIFVGEVKNMSGLQTMIDAKNAEHPWMAWWNSLGSEASVFAGWGGAWFAKQAAEDTKKNDGKEGAWGWLCRTISEKLGGPKTDAAATGPAAQPAVAQAPGTAAPEAAPVNPDQVTEFKYVFYQYHIDPNSPEAQEDAKALMAKYPNGYKKYATQALATDGILASLYDAIKGKLGVTDKFAKGRLLDIQLEAMGDKKKIKPVLEAITQSPANTTAEQFRKFLDAISPTEVAQSNLQSIETAKKQFA